MRIAPSFYGVRSSIFILQSLILTIALIFSNIYPVMARPLRLEFPGALYHITARGNEKRVMFKDESDYHAFERLLSELPERFGIVIHCYVLMSNHYHLLLGTSKANLSKSIHYLNAIYTGYFNKRHRRVGHLLQGCYKAILQAKMNFEDLTPR